MNVIVGPRGAGKTTQLIKLSAKNGWTIVTLDFHYAKNVINLAQKMALDIPSPITFNEFLNRMWVGSRPSGFLIDDAHILFEKMLIHEGLEPVQAIAISTD